jgi:four helix bundle suffix protein
MTTGDGLIPNHGGYRRLKSFQVAQLVYDVTVRFCARYVDRFSRTTDQMVQSARSGVQNIAEGSATSATSKKSELRLTSVARASLEELRLDYEDFLRQRGQAIWPYGDPRRSALIAHRPRTADDVALWVGLESTKSPLSTKSTLSTSACAANAALTLIAVASSLLDRQIAALANTFAREGGFTEHLYRMRRNARDS